MKKILYITLFLTLFLGCNFNSEDQNCTQNSDCSFGGECIEKSCKYFQFCGSDTDCNEGEYCLNGKCKDVECLSDTHCDDGIKCIDFICTNMDSKGVGESCWEYGPDECITGNCINDIFGAYCSDICLIDTDCPDNMVCNKLYGDTKYCQYGESEDQGDGMGGYGSFCDINGQSDCALGYSCIENIYNRDQDRCLLPCSSDNGCYLGYKCSYHDGRGAFCTPPKTRDTGELCVQFGGLECKDDKDSCISLIGIERYCTMECLTDQNCDEGEICEQFDSGNYCIKPASSQFGERCDISASLQCSDDLICDLDHYKIPFCTKNCENDIECGDYFSCSVTMEGNRYCRPAPNGLGDRDAIVGESCIEHGDSDCAENMLCLSGYENNPKAYCTYHCIDDSDCPENFHCGDPSNSDNKVCVKGILGEMGSNCTNESCNSGLYCRVENSSDLTGFCTKRCQNEGEMCEKEGYYCNEVYLDYMICTSDQPSTNIEGNIGDLCPNGISDCKSGLSCVFSIDGNFCTQICDQNTPCPENHICGDYNEELSVCYKN